jgi:O-antigen/teichoic acid export membrane protein
MTLIDTFRKDVKSALSKGAFHLFVSMVFSQGIALLLGIVLARLLGPENLGHVRVIQAVLQWHQPLRNTFLSFN